MNRPLRVFAMARPRRPTSERAAVLAAAALLPKRSARATALAIAREVAADCVAWTALDPDDELIARLAEIEALTKPAPIVMLSRCADIGTASLVTEARTRRFQARGCRQLGALEWQRETEQVTAEVAEILARRYRDFLAEN